MACKLVNFARSETEADLEDYYYKQSPIIWGLIVLGTLEGTFIIPLIEQEPILHMANVSSLPTTTFCVTLAASKNRLVHAILAPIVLALILLDTWVYKKY